MIKTLNVCWVLGYCTDIMHQIYAGVLYGGVSAKRVNHVPTSPVTFSLFVSFSTTVGNSSLLDGYAGGDESSINWSDAW